MANSAGDPKPLEAPIRPRVERIASIDDLANAIRAVVDYNWKDELRDYEGDKNDSREVHIFNHLVALDNWINGTPYTPESYLRETHVLIHITDSHGSNPIEHTTTLREWIADHGGEITEEEVRAAWATGEPFRFTAESQPMFTVTEVQGG
jgi:hypothetical protein